LASALELEAATEPKDLLPANQLKQTTKTAAPLKLIDGDELEVYVKNGVLLESVKHSYQAFYNLETDGGVDFSPAPPSSSPPAPQRYSETNTHVVGVDEADFAKYDGKHWFVVSVPDGSEGVPGIQILATDPEAPSVEIVGGINLSTENWPAPVSIYLSSDGEQ